MPVEGGRVTIDRTAQNRRAGTVQIPWSLELGDDLGIDIRTLPLGGYALVSRGLRYGDGSTELVAARPAAGRVGVLGHARDVARRSSWPTGWRRSATSRSRPRTPPPADARQAAVGIVQGVFGDHDRLPHPATSRPPCWPTCIYTGSRADALSALEQGYGAETYFDANGDFVFAEKPGRGRAGRSGRSTPPRPG